MTHLGDYSDESLNAYMDGELSSDEQEALLERLEVDGELAHRLCQLRKVRDMMQLAYAEVNADPQSGAQVQRSATRYRWAVAASLLVAVGAAAGWMCHASLLHQPSLTELAQSVQMNGPSGLHKEWRVVLHVTTNDPYRLKTALDETEHMLRANHESGRPVAVELLVNGEGLRLLRRDASPFGAQIRAMQQEFDSLSLLACGKTIQRLRTEKGINVELLPDTVVVPSALQEILRRQQEGWAYIRI